MTTLTMPGRPKHDAGLRPVPWRRMAWVTWRQHRAALAGVAVFLGALAVYLWLTGLQIHHSYATACHSASSLACNINFTGRYAVTVNAVRVFLQAAPALIGAFAGAPVLARELETGTFRFAWTQGIGRWRWTPGKLVLLAVIVAAAAAAFSMLFSCSAAPRRHHLAGPPPGRLNHPANHSTGCQRPGPPAAPQRHQYRSQRGHTQHLRAR